MQVKAEERQEGAARHIRHLIKTRRTQSVKRKGKENKVKQCDRRAAWRQVGRERRGGGRESRGAAGAGQVLSLTFAHKQEGGSCGREGRWAASG